MVPIGDLGGLILPGDAGPARLAAPPGRAREPSGRRPGGGGTYGSPAVEKELYRWSFLLVRSWRWEPARWGFASWWGRRSDSRGRTPPSAGPRTRLRRPRPPRSRP